MIFKYITFSISIAFISWIVGMIVNAFLMKTIYYQKKLSNLNFIKSDKLNRVLGIDIFKWIVINTFFKFFNPKLKLNKRVNLVELNYLRNEMTNAEISHLIGFGFMIIFAAFGVINGKYLSATTIMFVNILMNLYPSLLQQENKRRIDRFIKINLAK